MSLQKINMFVLNRLVKAVFCLTLAYLHAKTFYFAVYLGSPSFTL